MALSYANCGETLGSEVEIQPAKQAKSTVNTLSPGSQEGLTEEVKTEEASQRGHLSHHLDTQQVLP